MGFGKILIVLVLLNFGLDSYAQRRFNIFNNSEIKLLEKAEKRKIEKGTHILSFYLTNNQYPMIVRDQSIFLLKEESRGIYRHQPFSLLVDAVYFNYQYCLSHQVFIESGIQYLKHWTTIKPNSRFAPYFFNRSNISTLCLNLGGGYRLKGENNFRFFDIHSGITIGLTDNPIGSGAGGFESSSYLDEFDNVQSFSYSYQYKVVSKIIFGFYVGASKDFMLTKNLYLSARYHYQFGKSSNIVENEITYNLPALGIYHTVKAHNTMHGQMFALGVKWRF